MAESNTAKLTEEYIQTHPSIKDCLKKGLINYSSLARQIADELGIEKKSSFDAILVASRRYSKKLGISSDKGKQIRNLLKNGKLEIKNKITVFAISLKAPLSEIAKISKKIAEADGAFHVIQGSKAITLITNNEFAYLLKDSFKNSILDIKENLVEVSLVTSPEIQNISGVNAYIYSLFADNDINMVDTMDAWADNIFIVAEKDLQKTIEILKF